MSLGQNSTDTFVKLVTANGMTEADTWKAVLEAAGITVYLRHEAVGSVIPETVGELAAVDLWVPRDQAAEANQILLDERIAPTGGEDDLG